jgi:hypothetical protein
MSEDIERFTVNREDVLDFSTRTITFWRLVFPALTPSLLGSAASKTEFIVDCFGVLHEFVTSRGLLFSDAITPILDQISICRGTVEAFHFLGEPYTSAHRAAISVPLNVCEEPLRAWLSPLIPDILPYLELERSAVIRHYAARESSVATTGKGGKDLVATGVETYSHDEHFHLIRWSGKEYHLKKGHQSEAMRHLWADWQSGGGGLTNAEISEKIGSSSESQFRLAGTFRKFHPLITDGVLAKRDDGIWWLLPRKSAAHK